jgi:phosphatidylglycerol:prolipoprotein diacylglycerol transferase
MHPELITFDLFGTPFTLHFYGVIIAFGAAVAYFYLARVAKRDLGIDQEVIQGLLRWIIFAAIVGGKLFFYLEKPAFYFGQPSNMLLNFRTGFVFYGSLIFAVPIAIYYVRKHGVPVLPFLDRLAIVACIIHAFGRLGCFMAGCCYGVPSNGPFQVTYTDPLSEAPLHQALHPTQLYEIALILGIMVILLMFRRYQRFEGQLFFIYVMLYGVGRCFTELYRGDVARGYIIDGVLSHSQFISLVLVAGVAVVYWYFGRKVRENR